MHFELINILKHYSCEKKTTSAKLTLISFLNLNKIKLLKKFSRYRLAEVDRAFDILGFGFASRGESVLEEDSVFLRPPLLPAELLPPLPPLLPAVPVVDISKKRANNFIQELFFVKYFFKNI